MGVWACSSGTLRFGARLSQEVLDKLVKELAPEVENGRLERQDHYMDEDEGYDPEKVVSLEDLSNRLDFWLKMRAVQRTLLVVSAGIADAASPLRLLAGQPDLLKMIFCPLMPVKVPTLKSLIAAKAANPSSGPAAAADLDDAHHANQDLGAAIDLDSDDDDDFHSQPTSMGTNEYEAIARCIRDFGAEPIGELEALPAWQRKEKRMQQLYSLYRKRHPLIPLELQIDFAATFEGYGEEFPFYILGVVGEQDAPQFSGEKKLSWNDGDCNGVDFCDPIGVFSAPEGGAEKITAAIDTLRAGGMLPPEKTEAEIAEMRRQGRIIMPNIPYVAKVGWNVIGHSHVG